ncbi:outer membrane beta-barrel family protein [Parapedobacter tibetensis]|uniref:outer membrane beta-barrel family protein n=1 Tax=Parapedobacter tibetensis TaxID=2972951 RepID=UPI00214DADCC|nr:outer membrane beta-barrel family protein [Parapedobacter tibetensis]
MDFARNIRIGWIFLIVIFILPLGVAAQEGNAKVSGVVIDEASKEPVGFASATLLKQDSENYINGMQTAADGKILFTDVAPGTYMVRVTYVGYEDLLKENIVVEAGKDVDLGGILLKSSGELLEEVVVEGTPPAMQLGIDRKIFNVAQSTISVGGTATDLLANVPSLQVDMDGTVSLRGSSSVRILINGRESAMAGSDITQFLQSLPANSVERIEVITNPSSRYDAEGQSGIIDIILKKNTRSGLNGAINASGGSYNNYMAGLNLNFRDEKFNYFGSYTFNRRNMVGNGVNNTELLTNNSLTNNVSESERLGLNHGVQLGLDYYWGEKTVIGLSGNLSLRGNERNEDLFYNYLNHSSLSGTSTRLSRQDEDDLGFDLNLDIRRSLRNDGEQLIANVAFGKDSEEGINTFNQDYSQPPGGEYERMRINDTEEDGRNLNLQLDYVRPFSENHKFEAGYRSIIRSSQDYQYSQSDSTGGGLLPDYSVSNDFDMTSTVHALYTNYQNKLTDKLGFQVGLRAEQAYLDTELGLLTPGLPENEQQIEGKLDYFRIYPSVFLTQEFGNENQLQLSYTRRVSRPRGWQVNPFVDVSDNLNRRQGNPNLLPEDIHSFELGYTKTWSSLILTSSIYHRIVNDVVQPIIIEVDENTGVTLMQWQNISRNEATGFELISKIDFSKKWDVMANVNAFQTRFRGSEAFGIAPSEGFSWNANATTNYRFTSTLSAQARFDYQAPRIMAQGKGIETFVVDAGVKLDVLNKKGSIMFNVRDLLNQRRWGGYTVSNNVYRYFESRWMRRMFMLSFNYRFGQQDFQDKDKRRKQDMDDFNGGEEF